MLEFISYLSMYVLLVFFMVPWVMLFVVPALLFTIGAGVLFYASSTWFGSQTKMKDKIRVLLIDDSPSTLILIKSILGSRNCILKTVNSGLKAVEELNHEKYDLIVLDYFMPGLNGSETLKLAAHTINSELEKNERLKVKYKPEFQMPVIEYSSGKEDSVEAIETKHFTLVGKLNKRMPPSILRPLVNQILAEVSACAV